MVRWLRFLVSSLLVLPCILGSSADDSPPGLSASVAVDAHGQLSSPAEKHRNKSRRVFRREDRQALQAREESEDELEGSSFLQQGEQALEAESDADSEEENAYLTGRRHRPSHSGHEARSRSHATQLQNRSLFVGTEEASHSKARSSQDEALQSSILKEYRRYLGLPATPCSVHVQAMEPLSDQEALPTCQEQHGLTEAACRNALKGLGARPWSARAQKEVCAMLGEPMLEDLLGQPKSHLSGGLAEGLVDASAGDQAQALKAALASRVAARASTWLSSLDASTIPKARMLRPGEKCGAPHGHNGKASTLGACADQVKQAGGRYLIYGRSENEGECVEINTASADCPEGLEAAENFDFYKVDDLEAAGSCERPADFCREAGATYEVRDCDADGVPDPYCYGPGPGVSQYLGSKSECTVVVGGCEMRKLLAKDNDQCMSVDDDTKQIKVEECVEDLDRHQWYFAGSQLLTQSSSKCLVEKSDKSLGMVSCSESDAMKWFFDETLRLKNKAGQRCVTRNVETNMVYMTDCGTANNQKFFFSPIRDCKWSEWGEFSKCSASCGRGTNLRFRFVAIKAETGGRACDGVNKESGSCQASMKCPTHCTWTTWTDWSECSRTCGTPPHAGKKTRRRSVLDAPAFGGLPCVGLNKQTLLCNEIPCPNDCRWGTWGRWQSCSRRCGGGLRSRERVIAQHQKAGGKPCGCCATESLACNIHDCPVDCRWAAWPEWAECPKTCGGSTTQRYRDIMTQAKNGGRACRGDTKVVKECANTPCPVDCAWEMWDDWTACTTSCGVNDGVVTRVRGRRDAKFGGLPCVGVPREEDFCNDHECPIDCAFSPWDEWSPCFKGVFSGRRGCFKRRLRSVQADAEYGGHQCVGDDYQTSECKKCKNARPLAEKVGGSDDAAGDEDEQAALLEEDDAPGVDAQEGFAEEEETSASSSSGPAQRSRNTRRLQKSSTASQPGLAVCWAVTSFALALADGWK
eukprot:TRINITY_DN74213_c0_g1_i1.p1 TRINITY_DN74213_c0_g1~~TRINITY_DN74213_c0_g1_i1.p1  ORF type:complete len:978 (+),score=223.18 TRINITY_DN74213_c0_g1_i1:118-3051(+)